MLIYCLGAFHSKWVKEIYTPNFYLAEHWLGVLQDNSFFFPLWVLRDSAEKRSIVISLGQRAGFINPPFTSTEALYSPSFVPRFCVEAFQIVLLLGQRPCLLHLNEHYNLGSYLLIVFDSHLPHVGPY